MIYSIDINLQLFIHVILKYTQAIFSYFNRRRCYLVPEAPRWQVFLLIVTFLNLCSSPEGEERHPA